MKSKLYLCIRKYGEERSGAYPGDMEKEERGFCAVVLRELALSFWSVSLIFIINRLIISGG